MSAWDVSFAIIIGAFLIDFMVNYYAGIQPQDILDCRSGLCTLRIVSIGKQMSRGKEQDTGMEIMSGLSFT